MYHIFIHSSVDRQLGCFHLLAIVNSATMNFGVHVSFRSAAFSRFMLNSGIGGSYSDSDFPGGSDSKECSTPAVQETWVQSLGREDPLEEGMATHSSILAWRIPMDRGAWWACRVERD